MLEKYNIITISFTKLLNILVSIVIVVLLIFPNNVKRGEEECRIELISTLDNVGFQKNQSKKSPNKNDFTEIPEIAKRCKTPLKPKTYFHKLLKLFILNCQFAFKDPEEYKLVTLTLCE